MSIAFDHGIQGSDRGEWLSAIMAVLLPPLEVWRVTGFSRELWLNCALTVTAYFPGIMHALWVSQSAMAAEHAKS